MLNANRDSVGSDWDTQDLRSRDSRGPTRRSNHNERTADGFDLFPSVLLGRDATTYTTFYIQACIKFQGPFSSAGRTAGGGLCPFNTSNCRHLVILIVTFYDTPKN